MLAKRIIPCLDVHGGRVTKGIQFVNLRDAGDPVEQARFYDEEGADELVYLDISASVEGRKALLDLISRTASQVFIPLTVGGGIRTVEDMHQVLMAGADKVSINTGAVEDPSLIQRGAERFGSQCVVVAIDAKRRVGGGTGERPDPSEMWEVYTYGGRKATGLSAVRWAKRVEQLGAGEILLTSMDKDGTTDGYDLELTRAVSEAVRIPVIASGGAGSIDHIVSVLTEGKADAALAASIFHYRTVRIREVKERLAAAGIPVRL